MYVQIEKIPKVQFLKITDEFFIQSKEDGRFLSNPYRAAADLWWDSSFLKHCAFDDLDVAKKCWKGYVESKTAEVVGEA
jgi:hypothetical protein